MQEARDQTSRRVSRTGERQENFRRENMSDWAWIVGFVGLYILVTQWLLPKLGVPT